jgi:hypothetical protein
MPNGITKGELLMNYLDELAKLNSIERIVYADGTDPKPNDHCNLVDIGFSVSHVVWQENDEHFRNRIKEHQS